MQNQKTKRNILILCDTSCNDSRRVISSALRRLTERTDWSVTTLNFRNKGVIGSVRLLAKGNPFDGVIVTSPLAVTEELRRFMPNTVFLNATTPTNAVPPSPCVIDDRAIGTAAAEALVKLGYANFAYVGLRSHPTECLHSDLRASAFARKLKANGNTPLVLHLDDADLDERVKRLPMPVGVFAYNDAVAAKVIGICHAHRFAIPDQVAIIGTDNDPDICNNTRPPLSSVDPDFEAVGRNAIDALIAIFRNPRARIRLSAGVKDVVPRESMQSSKTGGRMVTVTRNLLRKRYAEKLTLGGIAASLHISPRLLSLRFREITGHTVHQELEKIRLTAARTMLEAETKPVKAIAAECGFPSIENFYRRYRRHYHATPRSCERGPVT